MEENPFSTLRTTTIGFVFTKYVLGTIVYTFRQSVTLFHTSLILFGKYFCRGNFSRKTHTINRTHTPIELIQLYELLPMFYKHSSSCPACGTSIFALYARESSILIGPSEFRAWVTARRHHLLF